MITKDHILESLTKECKICIRLFSKLPREAYDYRPAPDQRSTLELLQYLSYAFVASAHAIVKSDWEWWPKYAGSAKEMTPDQFPDIMTAQIKALRTLFSSIPDDVFENGLVSGMPWPTDKTVGVELMENCLHWLVGYKMQLFLYAKSNGVELNTMDCWFTTEDS